MLLWPRFNLFAALLMLWGGTIDPSYSQVVNPRRAAHQLIVKFRSDGSARERERALRNAAAVRPLGRGLKRPGIKAEEAGSTLIIDLPENIPTASELARLGSIDAVEYAEPNYPLRLFSQPEPLVPNDFEFSKMYALLNPGGSDAKTNADIHATEAWRYTTGDKKVIVAVIDTGIDYLHEDLKDNIWINEKEIPFNGIDDDGNGVIDDYIGYDFVSNDSDPYDDNEHGTHVAGIIGARGNNELGTAGVCWNVSLMALKAFDEAGNGTVEDAIAAIEYAVRNGARLINASWGLDEKSRALEEAVQKASDAGVLFVAAAGNNRSDAPSYPASFESVVSVGATDKNDARASFSNYGPSVDVAAPGDAIYSTLPENRYGYLSGTSMAAPHVTGVAALILARFPSYSRQELFDILINSVDVVPFDQPLGNGRLDASRAVRMDQPLPTARLQVPATVSGMVGIEGTAAGTFSTGFAVSIGKGKAPSNWVEIASSNQRVTNGLLAHLDTSVVSDGPSVIQLTVTNQNGSVATANLTVKVLNALISSPLSADVLAPARYDIMGTLYGANKQFELSYGSGLNPTSWSPLPSVGGETILQGKLGEWDTTRLPTGFYTLRMVSTSLNNRAEFLAPAIYVDQSLRPGWPAALRTDDDFPAAEWRNIRVADLDHDGKAEFIVVEPGTRNRQQRLVVLSLDGQERWSKDLGFDIPPDVPAIGDVNGDGKLEIFVDVPEGVMAFHADGSAVNGWPVKKTTRNHAKVLADLNRDGAIELITYSQEYSATQVPDLRELAVYSGQGVLIRKWDLPWCGFTNDVQKIFPAVANLDDDPQLEIVAVSGCSEIAAFDARRAEPKWKAAGEGIFLSSPVIGDVDGDGLPDVIVAAAAENDAPAGGVYAFHGDGQRWRGWPVLEEYSFSSPPALGDLDHDGRLEIVLASTEPSGLHVLQWDGFEADGWPLDAFHETSARVGVTLADIDADGTSEILTATPGFTSLALTFNDPDYVGGITARNLAGTIVPFNGTNLAGSLPFESFTPYRTHKASPPVVGDFDGDGTLDVALCSLQDRTFGTNLKLKNRSSLYAWKLRATSLPRSLEWPMFGHDLQNQNSYNLSAAPLPPGTNTIQAIRDRVLAGEDRELQIEPLKNDVGRAPLTIESFTQPAHGVVSRGQGETLLYVPAKDFASLDQFSYTIRDGTGAKSTAPILIRVKPVNDPPVAEDIHLTMKKNSSVSVFYNAKDPENAKVTFNTVDSPSNGELWNYPALGVYYPKRGFFGTDSFHYTASDGRRQSDPATVTIDVINSNNPPAASAQFFLTKTNRAVQIQPVAEDLDGDEISFELVQGPSHGTLTNQESSFRFTPARDYLGDDFFMVRPFDGTAYGDAVAMTVSVIATNASPKVQDGSAIVSPNSPTALVLSGRDPDGDAILFSITAPPLHGTLSGEPPRVTYLPATNYIGPDKFTFQVSDGFAESGPGTYNLQVVRRNRPPAGEDQIVSVLTGESVTIPLKLSDPDGDPIRSVILKGPAHGLLYGSGTNFNYVPATGAPGADSFTYKAWDGQKFGNVARVTILVSLPANELPPSFQSIAMSDGIVELLLGTPNANPFFIEASTNLLDWNVTAGPLVSATDQLTYKETNSLGAVRFYRARRQN